MFIWKVFAAFALALAVTTQGPRKSPAKPKFFANCSAPNVVPVPRCELINVRWYAYATNARRKINCHTITIKEKSKSATYGKLVDRNRFFYNTYPWTCYNNGILTFQLSPKIKPQTMVIQYYSNKSSHKVAVFYTCVHPSYRLNTTTVFVAASIHNLTQEEVDALKQQVIAADPNLQYTKFKPINQNCRICKRCRWKKKKCGNKTKKCTTKKI